MSTGHLSRTENSNAPHLRLFQERCKWQFQCLPLVNFQKWLRHLWCILPELPMYTFPVSLHVIAYTPLVFNPRSLKFGGSGTAMRSVYPFR